MPRSPSPRNHTARPVPGAHDVPPGVVNLGAGPAGAYTLPATPATPVELGAAAPGAPPHPVPHHVGELHAEVDAALVQQDAVNATVGPRIAEGTAAMAQEIAAQLRPILADLGNRLGAVEARAAVGPPGAAPAMLGAVPYAPFAPADPFVEVAAAAPMPEIPAVFGAWAEADGWLRAAALGRMGDVATAFLAAVQPTLQAGQLVALRAMTRAAIESAAEAGRMGLTAGAFIPLLRPQIVATLSYGVTMARANGGGVHPAFPASAVDELMSLPQWTTRAADTRLREVHERLRLFRAGASHRPAQAPENAPRGRRGRGRGGRQPPPAH